MEFIEQQAELEQLVHDILNEARQQGADEAEVSVSAETIKNVAGQVIYARQPTGHRRAFVVLQEQLVLIQQYRLV